MSERAFTFAAVFGQSHEAKRKTPVWSDGVDVFYIC